MTVTRPSIPVRSVKTLRPGREIFDGKEEPFPIDRLFSPHVKAGKLRILLTSQKIPDYPNVPTLKQLGYKRDTMSIRFSFYLPAGVPDSVKRVLVPAVEKAVQTPEGVNAIQQIGAIEDFIPGEEFKKKMMTDEYAMVRQLMKMSGAEGK